MLPTHSQAAPPQFTGPDDDVRPAPADQTRWTDPAPPLPHAESEDGALAPAHGPRAIYAFDRVFAFTRVRSLPALLMPVAVGSGLAWWQLDRFDPWICCLALVAASSFYLGTNAISCYYDVRRNLQHLSARTTGFSVDAEPRADALMGWGDILSVGWLLFLLALVANLWLAFLAGWPMFFFSGLTALLALAYALPPIHIGYRGRGLAEFGLLISFGYLPGLASFYAQVEILTWLSLVATLPTALLVARICFDCHILNWRRDWRFGKQTLAVALRPQRALDISAVMTVVAYGLLVLLVGTALLPVWTLLALAALPMALRPFALVRRDRAAHRDGVFLVRSATLATTLTGTLLVLALWLDKIV